SAQDSFGVDLNDGNQVDLHHGNLVDLYRGNWVDLIGGNSAGYRLHHHGYQVLARNRRHRASGRQLEQLVQQHRVPLRPPL
ncbi:MAG: hypothetical protein RL189_2344, partial [Pseudomonadota bacterium]